MEADEVMPQVQDQPVTLLSKGRLLKGLGVRGSKQNTQ